MPKNRGSRGQHKNRNKPHSKPKQSPASSSDNFRAILKQKERTDNKHLISGLKASAHNPEAINTLKK